MHVLGQNSVRQLIGGDWDHLFVVSPPSTHYASQTSKNGDQNVGNVVSVFDAWSTLGVATSGDAATEKIAGASQSAHASDAASAKNDAGWKNGEMDELDPTPWVCWSKVKGKPVVEQDGNSKHLQQQPRMSGDCASMHPAGTCGRAHE